MRARGNIGIDRCFHAKLWNGVFAPVDIASLVFFRIAFGGLMLVMVQLVWSLDRISQWWIEPSFLFKYPGFSWVHPWPGNGLYVHWILLGVFALFVTVGFLYRISATLFFLSHTYFFLLDQGRYVNHIYLICLFSFLLIFTPAHRAFSVDAWLWPKLRSSTAPAWSLWLLRGQMGVVYFFAGVAKIAPDWLQGEPIRTWFKQQIRSPALAHVFHQEWAAYGASYASLLIDLLIVPFLLWRRTRLVAFCLAVIFHLLNAQIFPLDIFPWLAIAATTLFLSPSWPRQIIAIFQRKIASPVMDRSTLPPRRKRILILGFVTLYVAIQILVPLRHFLYSGGIEWTYMEHRFSWQMMLERHFTRTLFYVADPNTGREIRVQPGKYLDLQQTMHMGWRPDMVWQFARFLANKVSRLGPEPLRVQVRMYVSVNRRRPQLFLDPNIDLAAEPRSWGRPRWLLQVHDPLPPPGQDLSADTFGVTFPKTD
ncbi:MAG TPA: HTTM domain-containing protein [Chthoniobacterales bacterium]|nr:HTTM domain-containing protein [Chthoniobacterales bacterium]